MLHEGTLFQALLTDTEGRDVPVGSSEHNGTFFYFMRTVTCAQCTAAVRRMVRGREIFDRHNVRVVVAVPDDRNAAIAWKTKNNVPFDVVVGATGTVHEDVGLVRKVFGFIQQSGSLLVDADAVVRRTHVAINPGASYDEADTRSALAELTSADNRS